MANSVFRAEANLSGWLLLVLSVVFSSVPWASVGVLEISGGGGIFSIASSDGIFACSLTRQEFLLPFGLFSNVQLVISKVTLLQNICFFLLILLLSLNN